MPALLGKKLGMTQIFDDAGNVVPVTVVDARPRPPGGSARHRPGPVRGLGRRGAQRAPDPGGAARSPGEPRASPKGRRPRMSMVTVYDAQGKQVGEVPLPPVLEAKPHTAVL